MPELWAVDASAVKRKFRELWAQDGTGVNRKHKKLWANDGTGVNRNLFNSSFPVTRTLVGNVLYPEGSEIAQRTETINGSDYKLMLYGCWMTSCYTGVEFDFNPSGVANGQAYLYLPDIYVTTASNSDTQFVINVFGFAQKEFGYSSSQPGTHVIPGRTITAPWANSGPFSLQLYFNAVNASYMNLDHVTFEIDLSKMIWLPTGSNFQLQ